LAFGESQAKLAQYCRFPQSESGCLEESVHFVCTVFTGFGSYWWKGNYKKNNYNLKKIERHLAYIETKTVEYLTELDANEKLKKVRKIKEKYTNVRGLENVNSEKVCHKAPL